MGSTATESLAVQLDSADVGERLAAAQALAHLAEEARPAAVWLVRAIRDEHEEVREWVSSALEDLGPPDPADADALARLLSDQNPDVGYWAATLLGRLGPSAAATVQQLATNLSSQTAQHVRERAAWALGKIGPAAIAAANVLRDVGNSDHPRLARLAQHALDQIVGT